MNQLIIDNLLSSIARCLLLSFVLGGLMTVVVSCSYSMIMTDTHGTATDVVDEQQAPTADIHADLSVPVSAIPSIPSFTK